MSYLPWLLGISAVFVLLERLRPARPGQRLLRPQLANDGFYLVFHGALYWMLFGSWIAAVAGGARKLLGGAGLLPEQSLLTGAPWLVQFAVFLAVSDFLMWLVHRLLHGVPWLWQFHKVHHSIHAMDWIGSFRFHVAETIVYRSLLYVPLLWLGGDTGPLWAVILVSTAWGHFNHANLDVGLGPLALVFNSPRMHLWHHDASAEGGVAKNFGITLSLWDHLFGTAFWPRDRAPAEIGYPQDTEMPADLPRQLVFPLFRRKAPVASPGPSDAA
jgi:sterol desaturase/sphingolipid hydroxylase (fatty acid hydroxylase superfamily)